MGRFTSGKLWATLLFAAPLPILAYVNLVRLFNGRGSEPLVDNVVGYLLLLVIFLAAASTLGIYHRLRGLSLPLSADILVYAACAAFGPTLLLLLVDYLDDYFSRPGIGWVWPISGAVLGASFGAILRIAYHWLLPRPARLD